MKQTRKIIEINDQLCNGCGQCVPSCAEGAIDIIDGKARLLAEKYCDGLGACLGDCPLGALKVVERVADDFDEEAVHELLASRKPQAAAAPSSRPACPGSQVRTFSATCPGAAPLMGGLEQGLGHWPIKIRLIKPDAPFLKQAQLVVAADCVPAAFPRFHQDIVPGRAVMIGCPKFDELDDYEKKFAEILRTANLAKLIVVRMEVPCCGALPQMLHKARQIAGVDIKMEEIVVSVRGEEISGREGAAPFLLRTFGS